MTERPGASQAAILHAGPINHGWTCEAEEGAVRMTEALSGVALPNGRGR